MSGKSTEQKIQEVVAACDRHGKSSIIALAGVPGTGKSHVGLLAAQRHASDPLMVRTVQFHQSFTYDEFVEGMRITSTGGVVPKDGVFLEWNARAEQDPDNQYVLVIEEFTRANVSAVLGELLTFVEHRDRPFHTIYSRRPVLIAKNLTILVTFNPTDQSSMELDAAILRRLRIISFPPDETQLREMLRGTNLPEAALERLAGMFAAVRKAHEESFDRLMPFGHGAFFDVEDETPDLHDVWVERLDHFLRRPGLQPHPYTAAIEEAYPWRAPSFRVVEEADGDEAVGAEGQEVAEAPREEPRAPVARPREEQGGAEPAES